MSVAKKYQAIVKNAGGVLVGVAQIRVGAPSVRAAGTAVIGVVQQVPESTKSDVTGVDGSTTVTIVNSTTTLTTKTNTLAASGTYTGAYDGAFIIRLTAADTCDIFAPNGWKESGVSLPLTNKNLNLASATSSGVLLSGDVTTGVDGTTFIVPVLSGSAQDKVNTWIVSPYSIFKEDTNSLGGLKSSSFTAKIEDQKTLTSGMPEEIFARIVVRTSVTVDFECQEYANLNVQYLKDTMNQMINNAKVPALPVEIVMASNDGTLYSFFVPSATIETLPSLAPTNDFSSFKWQLTAIRQTASGVAGAEGVILDTWIRESDIYVEASYLH